MPRFAAIGLDHRHIYDLTQGLLDAGAECVGYDPDTTDPRVLAGFPQALPACPRQRKPRGCWTIPAIDFIVIAAVPRDRADLAIAAMRRGKDVMVDKPGVTTAAQLAAVAGGGGGDRAASGRSRSAAWPRRRSRRRCASCVPANWAGWCRPRRLAPHRLNRALRPAWFFDTPAYGGIINDIGVHSIDQFLAFAGCRRCRDRAQHDRRVRHRTAGFEDFAELVLTTPSVRGYVPAGLVHARRPADLGRRALVRGRHRRHAGTAQEPGHRGPPRHRSYVRRQPQRHALHGLQHAAGDLLSRLRRPA